MIWRMVHFPGAGTKSTSSPAAPVSTVASTSAPRRKRSRSSAREFMSVVIRAAHVVAAFLAQQFTTSARQPGGADRAVEHCQVLIGRLLRSDWILLFHSTTIILSRASHHGAALYSYARACGAGFQPATTAVEPAWSCCRAQR